ncbi:hypothetical protein PVAG01_10892 [Phlyctema vagabunda]|uniref:PHD-type domain-containing protein n=1 Tax=Phlyctema vagabunda TaxID=108571 RepID=A0ABR4P3L3_9HELO
MASTSNIIDFAVSQNSSQPLQQRRSTQPERRTSASCRICREKIFDRDSIACTYPNCSNIYHPHCLGVQNAILPEATWVCPDCHHKKTVTRKHAYGQLRSPNMQNEERRTNGVPDTPTSSRQYITDGARDAPLPELPVEGPEEQGFLMTIEEEDEDRRSSVTSDTLAKRAATNPAPSTYIAMPGHKKKLTDALRWELSGILQELDDDGLREADQMIHEYRSRRARDLEEKNERLMEDRTQLAEENRKLKDDLKRLQLRSDSHKRGELSLDRIDSVGRSGNPHGLPSKARSHRIASKSSMSKSSTVNGSMADVNPLSNTDQLSFSSGVQLQGLHRRNSARQATENIHPGAPSRDESLPSLNTESLQSMNTESLPSMNTESLLSEDARDAAEVEELQDELRGLVVTPRQRTNDGRQSRMRPRTDSVLMIRARTSTRAQVPSRKSTRWTKMKQYFRLMRQEKPKAGHEDEGEKEEKKKDKRRSPRTPEKERKRKVISKPRHSTRSPAHSHLFTPTQRRSLLAVPYELPPARTIPDTAQEDPTKKASSDRHRSPRRPSRYGPIVISEQLASPSTDGDNDGELLITPTQVKN